MLEWIEYIPPTPSELLDKKSMLRIVIKSAHFLKDMDLIGKQDPYITFKYEDKTLQTDVKDGAGLNATFDETFQLPNIKSQVDKGGNIVFEALDKDLVSSDLLGVSDALDFEDYVEDDRVHEFDLELYDDKGQKAGNLRLSTQVVFVLPDPPLNPTLNYNCMLEIKIKEANFFKDQDTFGKQDPYIQFQYEDMALKTEVQDDAGLNAKFEDEFQLENIEIEIKKGGELKMEAYDKDLASSDLLGVANTLSYVSLVENTDEKLHDLDLFINFKKSGNVKFTTRFIWQEPDPDPNPLLNPNCRLVLIVQKASFLKDADLIGKQDPYIQFAYNGKKVQTEVKDGAGLNAEWNEKFRLTQVHEQVLSGKRLVLEAYDKDVLSSDFLGATKGLSFVTLVESEDIKQHTLILLDKAKKKAGELHMTSQFIYVPPDPEINPDLNRNCILRVTFIEGKFFKDNDTFGK